jgi:hypothetical protein
LTQQQRLLQQWQPQLLLLQAWQQALPSCHRSCQTLQLMCMRRSSSNGSWTSSSTLALQMMQQQQLQQL